MTCPNCADRAARERVAAHGGDALSAVLEELGDLLWGVRRDLDDQAQGISRAEAFGLLAIIDAYEHELLFRSGPKNE